MRSFFPQNLWLDSLSCCWWNTWWECSGMLMNGGVWDTIYIGENWDGMYKIKYLPRFKWLSWRLQISWGQNSGTFVQEFLWMLVSCLTFLNENGEQLTWGSQIGSWVLGNFELPVLHWRKQKDLNSDKHRKGCRALAVISNAVASTLAVF